MSRRESIYMKTQVPFESPPSPNSTVDEITIEVRIFYPPNACQDDLVPLWSEVAAEVHNQLTEVVLDGD